MNVFSHAIIDLARSVTKSVLILFDVFPEVSGADPALFYDCSIRDEGVGRNIQLGVWGPQWVQGRALVGVQGQSPRKLLKSVHFVG